MQIKKVLSGGTVHIHPHKVGHGHTFHLTTLQHSKLHRHVTAGKGMRIHFNPHQIHHHMRHGGGVLDFLKGAARAVARPALGALLGLASSRLGPGLAGKVANIAGQKGIDVLGSKLGFGIHRRRRRVGAGLRRRRRHHHHKGGSFATIGRHGGSFTSLGGHP